jgi:hypothetical protein
MKQDRLQQIELARLVVDAAHGHWLSAVRHLAELEAEPVTVLNGTPQQMNRVESSGGTVQPLPLGR